MKTTKDTLLLEIQALGRKQERMERRLAEAIEEMKGLARGELSFRGLQKYLNRGDESVREWIARSGLINHGRGRNHSYLKNEVDEARRRYPV